MQNTKLVNTKTNENFAVELLAEQPAFERVMLFYKPSLERLGMTVSVRTIDPVAIRKPAAAMGFRHRHRFVGRIAVARQRAARLLGLASCRHTRLA